MAETPNFTRARPSLLPTAQENQEAIVASTARAMYPWQFSDIVRNNLTWAKNDLIVYYTSSKKYTITATYLSVQGLGLSAVSLVMDAATTGAGGRQSGITLTADTWYDIFVIASTTGSQVYAYLDTVNVAPTLPAGFSLYRRVATVRYNPGATDFLRSAYVADWCYWNEVLAAAPFQVLTGGSSATLADVDCSVAVPPRVARAIVSARLTSGAATTAYYTLIPKGSNLVDDASTRVGSDVAMAVGKIRYDPPEFRGLSSAQKMSYLVSDANHDLDLYVHGYFDPC